MQFFSREKKREERENSILTERTECVFLVSLCCFLKKPDELARRRGRVRAKSIYRLKRTPWNDVPQILVAKVGNVVNDDRRLPWFVEQSTLSESLHANFTFHHYEIFLIKIARETHWTRDFAWLIRLLSHGTRCKYKSRLISYKIYQFVIQIAILD